MGEHHSATALMIVVISAFVVPIVLHRLRMKAIPVVVAEIVIGLILGKSGLGVVGEDDWLTLLSTLGIIYLMFLSGLEIDFEMIQEARARGNGPVKAGEKAVNPLTVSIAAFAAILGASALLAFGFRWMGYVNDVFFMTLIISTVSLGVIFPVLKDKGILETPLGQAILITAVVADFMTMVLLAVYVALRSTGGMSNVLLLLLLFVIFFAVARLSRRMQANQLLGKIRKETVSIGTRGVFALILFFVALSEGVGAENILGAFLAGVIVSLLSPPKTFVRQLNAFGYGFLIPIFFVMVGVNLDLPGLLGDSRALTMMPLLLVAFLVSKLVVIPVFRRWFAWRESISSGILLTSTLSLVIAAAKVGMEMGLIDNTVNTALVLGAVITALLAPIFFQSTLPAVQKEPQQSVSLVGINAATMTLAQNLVKDDYRVTIYGNDTTNLGGFEGDRPYGLVQLPVDDKEQLRQAGAFDAQVLVTFSSDDQLNLEIAQEAEASGVKQVIARVEGQGESAGIQEGSQIQLFSSLFSNGVLLKALIEYPTLIKLMTHEGHLQLQEIELGNERYHDLTVRDLPFLGDTLIIRIFREQDTIVPHGDTVLQVGDRLIISGSPVHTRRLRELLE